MNIGMEPIKAPYPSLKGTFDTLFKGYYLLEMCPFLNALLPVTFCGKNRK